MRAATHPLEHYRRSTALRDAALDLIREAVASSILHTAKDVAGALQIPKVAIAARRDKLEASLVYTRFHGISSRSNRLLNIRRGVVAVHDLDTLCQVVSVLREERALANSSPTALAAAKAISGVIVDAQERLIFCANSAVNREVVKFKPSPDDLDYPNKLILREQLSPFDGTTT